MHEPPAQPTPAATEPLVSPATEPLVYRILRGSAVRAVALAPFVVALSLATLPLSLAGFNLGLFVAWVLSVTFAERWLTRRGPAPWRVAIPFGLGTWAGSALALGSSAAMAHSGFGDAAWSDPIGALAALLEPSATDALGAGGVAGLFFCVPLGAYCAAYLATPDPAEAILPSALELSAVLSLLLGSLVGVLGAVLLLGYAAIAVVFLFFGASILDFVEAWVFSGRLRRWDADVRPVSQFDRKRASAVPDPDGLPSASAPEADSQLREEHGAEARSNPRSPCPAGGTSLDSHATPA